MSFFDSIRAFFSGGKSSVRRDTNRLYIIDAAQLAGGNIDRLSPRDQVQILQQLSKFAEREGIAIQAVFEGRALREVASGDTYGGITVYFADKASALQDQIVSLVRDGVRRKTVTVVTANSQLEKRVIEAGATTLRPSTFRKAMEPSGGGPGGGGDRDRGQRRRGDRDRRRPQRSRQPQEPSQPQEQPSSPVAGESAPAAEPSQTEEKPRQADNSHDSVRDLIDLVE